MTSRRVQSDIGGLSEGPSDQPALVVVLTALHANGMRARTTGFAVWTATRSAGIGAGVRDNPRFAEAGYAELLGH